MISTTYFDNPGPENTDECLALARARADELGIRNVIIPSNGGASAKKALAAFPDFNVTIVGSVYGFKVPNCTTLSDVVRQELEDAGAHVIISGHAFGMVGRAVNQKFGVIQIDELIAHVLRIFGQGVKVCCEVACMAVDAGHVMTTDEAIAFGGTEEGLDTAIVLTPANTYKFFDMQIHELICKPRL